MTNKEDIDGDVTHDNNPRMAALLAVHLVSQVLDEAYVIANAAKDSGQPWRNLSILKSFKTGRLCDIDTYDQDVSFEASKGDCELNENETEIVANVVATSTPQKMTARVGSIDEGELLIPHSETTFIGQGDEDLESQQNELANSTSMFLNHLFDMSDVEHIACDDTELEQGTSDPDLLAETMNKIMDCFIANNLIPLETFPLIPNVEIVESQSAELSRSDDSDYSFLADAFIADISRDVAFYIDGDVSREKHEKTERYQNDVVEEVIENFSEQVDESTENSNQKNDVALYENAYATLNRDYDQGSEEDGFPVLQDPKGVTLQEVQLMTADTSDDNLSYPEFPSKQEPKEAAAPTVSGVSGSRKSTLVRRCRIQGARLLACLRGWWRRKTPGKRKESRCPAVLGMCPLSPDARRRATSLMDNRILRSPSPTRQVVWKFNTVNEVLVKSNRWKDYTFDAKVEDCENY